MADASVRRILIKHVGVHMASLDVRERPRRRGGRNARPEPPLCASDAAMSFHSSAKEI